MKRGKTRRRKVLLHHMSAISLQGYCCDCPCLVNEFAQNQMRDMCTQKTNFHTYLAGFWVIQACQLSRKIRESHGFSVDLTLSRLASSNSRKC